MPRMEPAGEVLETVRAALEEDRADADRTTRAVVPDDRKARGRILARAEGVLSGVAYATAAFRLCDPAVELEWLAEDGDRVQAGEVVLRCSGLAAGLLAAERTALNFLQQLSGVATATARMVAAAGPGLELLDTRKTVPGLRAAQKQAVVHGGGRNHRRDLEDQLLLKENHFALSGLSYAETVRQAVAAAEGRVVGVEAETEEQAIAALENGASYVLLDDFPDDTLAEVIARLRRSHPGAVIEVSGGVRLERVAHLRHSGADRISVGWITHSAPALDLSFGLERAAGPS
ncbi:MAG: carboxylating nicotinate-nucleotide diphosphorylase [Planctomycetota bacterium]|nr:MAG: carboxylating nicotinate-nucleotide diphosphorylase [Planctomycetota bacterium]